MDPMNMTAEQKRLNGCDGDGYCKCGEPESDEESGICPAHLKARDDEGEVA